MMPKDVAALRIPVMALLLICLPWPSAADPGWRSLFNGADLTGWRGYKNAAAPTRWRVEDGAITWTPDGGNGDLVSAEAFGDFELALEWKIAEGGNSGIIYFVQEIDGADQTYATGPEMQVLDDARHPDGKLPSHRAGALYDLIPPSVAAAKPPGQWNAARIVARGGRIEHWLNGRRVVSTRYGNDAWRALVAGSKFDAMPHFAKVPRGRIALQDHGDRVQYRNIRIRTFAAK
jgi:hypothetical protein